MTDNTQPEALRLADHMDGFRKSSHKWHDGQYLHKVVAAELRSQHARIAELEAQLPNGCGAPPEGITRDDTVHGETYFTAADMATASAQGFRDGVASVAASAREPVACGNCGGTGWMVRDPDIGTNQECFVCEGSGSYSEAAPPTSAEGVEHG